MINKGPKQPLNKNVNKNKSEQLTQPLKGREPLKSPEKGNPYKGNPSKGGTDRSDTSKW